MRTTFWRFEKNAKKTQTKRKQEKREKKREMAEFEFFRIVLKSGKTQRWSESIIYDEKGSAAGQHKIFHSESLTTAKSIATELEKQIEKSL
jgi:hypothetical protein